MVRFYVQAQLAICSGLFLATALLLWSAANRDARFSLMRDAVTPSQYVTVALLCAAISIATGIAFVLLRRRWR